MKKLLILAAMLCLTLSLAAPASTLEYTIDAPGDPDYGKSTSIEPVATEDGGAQKNEDVSKNAALIPPSFDVLLMRPQAWIKSSTSCGALM